MAAKKPAARPKGARPVAKQTRKKAAARPPKGKAPVARTRDAEATPASGSAPPVGAVSAVSATTATAAEKPANGAAPGAAVAAPAPVPAPVPPIVIPPPGVPLAPLVKVVPAAPVAAPPAEVEPTAAPGPGRTPAGPRRRPVKKVARRGPPPKRAPGRPGHRPPPPRGHGRRRKLPPRWVERLFAEPNVDGPRVRVGILWFALLAPAIWFGPRPTAALFGLVAVIGALQNGQAWRFEGYRPSRLVAALIAAAMPAAAIFSYSVPGLILAVSPVLALAAAFAMPRRRRRTSAFAAAGITLRCALPVGLAAAGMVFVTRLGPAPTIAFVVLLIGYDIGSFVVGAESSSPSHGIIGGAITTMVFAAPMWFLGVAFDLPPFGGSAAWIFGGMVAVFAPLGQMAASLCMPTASTWVPALRRLDSYILTAPLWTWAMWGYLSG